MSTDFAKLKTRAVWHAFWYIGRFVRIDMEQSR